MPWGELFRICVDVVCACVCIVCACLWCVYDNTMFTDETSARSLRPTWLQFSVHAHTGQPGHLRTCPSDLAGLRWHGRQADRGSTACCTPVSCARYQRDSHHSGYDTPPVPAPCLFAPVPWCNVLKTEVPRLEEHLKVVTESIRPLESLKK